MEEHADAHAPAQAHAPAVTNGHSNINVALTANIPKVFHNVSIARGVEPHVNPLAYGTQGCVRASGASAFRLKIQLFYMMVDI